MQLSIDGPPVRTSLPLEQHAERRLRFALDRFVHCVREVALRITEPTGPRPHAAMDCGLQVTLSTGDRIFVHERDADPYRAIDVAAGRLKRIVRERVRIRRERRRRRPR